jgi:phospholipase/carboxylesterase
MPVVSAGVPLATADAAMILVHGRNAAPANILSMLPRIDRPQFACLAPAAAGGAWYPQTFMAPRKENEPGVSSALEVFESLVVDLLARGFPSHKIVMLGFSQGACLSSEFVLRHPRRYGALLALSGGLLGPAGTTWNDVSASFDGTPVFLGCSDRD